MSDKERIDALAEVLFALLGDLEMAGALPKWKRDMLWVKVNQIRGDEDYE